MQDLCTALDVKERTLFNDLKELKDELGVEIQFDRVRRGYFLEADDLELNFMMLTEETAVLLLTAIELLELHSSPGVAEPLRQLFDLELRNCLGETRVPRTGARSAASQSSSMSSESN